MGLVSAADPLGFTAGMGWKFSHDGQYLIFKEPPGQPDIFTQVAVGDSGNIIFTHSDEKNRLEEIYASEISNMFNPTFSLSSNILETNKYDGMVDVLATLTGLTSKRWLPEGGESNLSRLIHGRVFYQGEVTTPVQSYTPSELKNEVTLQNFYQDLFIQLQRNTTRIPWK